VARNPRLEEEFPMKKKLVLVAIAVVLVFVAREIPSLVRYVKIERM
jgi:hypothetical protein